MVVALSHRKTNAVGYGVDIVCRYNQDVYICAGDALMARSVLKLEPSLTESYTALTNVLRAANKNEKLPCLLLGVRVSRGRFTQTLRQPNTAMVTLSDGEQTIDCDGNTV